MQFCILCLQSFNIIEGPDIRSREPGVMRAFIGHAHLRQSSTVVMKSGVLPRLVVEMCLYVFCACVHWNAPRRHWRT